MAGKHLTIEEKEMIRECFESGMTIRETAELTGRSTATIKTYRKSLKNQSCATEKPDVPKAPIEETVKKEPEKYIQDLQDDPRWKPGCNIEVSRIVKISGKKTGFRYVFDESEDHIVIRNDLGQEFHVGKCDFTKFIDELSDIEAEIKPCKRTA